MSPETFECFAHDEPIKSHGSGFFINKNGLILTNAHVIEGHRSISIITTDKKTFPANVVASDEWADLALIKVDLHNTNSLNIEFNDTKFEIGDEVIAIGAPFRQEFEHSISKGIISSVRYIDGNKVIQTDAAVNPGNSGGPLIHNESQKVIGIISMRIVGADGIGFALPVEAMKKFIATHATAIHAKK